MAETADPTNTFEAKFNNWKRLYMGYDENSKNSTKSYKPPSQGNHLAASLMYEEVQYDTRDPTFIRRTKDSDEIKEEFKPGKGIDAAIFFKTSANTNSEELRAQMITRMDDLAQKRVHDTAPFVQEYDDIQTQLLETIKEWKHTEEAGVKVQIAVRVGELQKLLAEADEKRNKALYPHTYIVPYKPASMTAKNTTISVWKATDKTAAPERDTAAEEETAPAAEKKKFGKKTDKNGGYRLVRSMTNAVERTVLL